MSKATWREKLIVTGGAALGYPLVIPEFWSPGWIMANIKILAVWLTVMMFLFCWLSLSRRTRARICLWWRDRFG